MCSIIVFNNSEFYRKDDCMILGKVEDLKKIASNLRKQGKSDNEIKQAIIVYLHEIGKVGYLKKIASNLRKQGKSDNEIKQVISPYLHERKMQECELMTKIRSISGFLRYAYMDGFYLERLRETFLISSKSDLNPKLIPLGSKVRGIVMDDHYFSIKEIIK